MATKNRRDLWIVRTMIVGTLAVFAASFLRVGYRHKPLFFGIDHGAIVLYHIKHTGFEHKLDYYVQQLKNDEVPNTARIEYYENKLNSPHLQSFGYLGDIGLKLIPRIRPSTREFVLPLWIPLAILLVIQWRYVHRPTRLAATRRANNQCEHCGYDLKGQVNKRCPECGKGTANSRSRDDLAGTH